MNIAITSEGKDLDSKVDPRLGRTAYFIIIDPGTLAFEVVENSQNLNLPQGAGIQAGKTIVDHKVDVLLTGNCGPKAFRVLQNAGVKVITGVAGRVKDVLQQFKNNELQEVQQANVDEHWV